MKSAFHPEAREEFLAAIVARSECKRLGVDIPITSVQIEMRKAGIKLQTKVVSIKRGVE